MHRAYFENYCGYGPYDEQYRFHSGIAHCIRTVERQELPVRSVCVLGAATGRVLEDFERAWDIRPNGCELSAWAHSRIPARLRRRVARADLRDYVDAQLSGNRSVDLIFTNALVYLPASEVPSTLQQCAEYGRWLHFWSSTSEDYEPGDRDRVLLRPRLWWRKAFRRAGFSPTRSPYLWRSELS